MNTENTRPTDNDEDYITVWEAPKIEAPEFRLYYNKINNTHNIISEYI